MMNLISGSRLRLLYADGVGDDQLRDTLKLIQQAEPESMFTVVNGYTGPDNQLVYVLKPDAIYSHIEVPAAVVPDCFEVVAETGPESRAA